jgi:hypothetical protein
LSPCAADGQPLPAHMHAASSIRLYRQTDRSEETRVFEAEAGRLFQVAVDYIFQVHIPRLQGTNRSMLKVLQCCVEWCIIMQSRRAKVVSVVKRRWSTFVT